MNRHFRWCVAVVTAAVLGNIGRADRIMPVAPPKPAAVAVTADVIVLGKVVEVEKDAVEAAPYKGAPKEQKISYKIAVVKIEDPLVGARGLTQLRVGFPADAAAPAVPGSEKRLGVIVARPSRGPVALAAEMDGVFLLAPHHDGDFYVLVNNAAPLLKKDADFDKELAGIKKVAAAVDDPVAALKAKDKADRSAAAHTILMRYRGRPAAGKVVEEDVPAEENKLLVQALTEMTWLPDGNDNTKPSRSTLWRFLQAEKLGFKAPVFKPNPAESPQDYNKTWEAATAEFLTANADKIKIKKMVGK